MQKEEKKDRSADILELSTHTNQDHRSQKFSVWFTVSQRLHPLFIKKNSNLQRKKKKKKKKKTSWFWKCCYVENGEARGPVCEKPSYDCLALNRSCKEEMRSQRRRTIFARAAELDPGRVAQTAATGDPPTDLSTTPDKQDVTLHGPAASNTTERQRGFTFPLSLYENESESRKDAAEAEACSHPEEDQGSWDASPLPLSNRRNQAVNKPSISALQLLKQIVLSGKYEIFILHFMAENKEAD